MYTLQIQKILNTASHLSDKDKDKIRYFLQAIQLADENNDIDWAYELRMQLMDIEWEHNDRRNFLPTFSWLLNAYDERPDQHNPEELLWKYKWIISEVQSNPDISKTQIAGIMKDFKRRSEKEGYNLRAYHSKLLHKAAEEKDIENSRLLQGQITAFQRDGISDCQACELDSEVLVHLQANEFDAGYNKAHPILQEQYTCARVPIVTRINLAYYALKNNQKDIAEQLSERVEQELSDREEDTYLISSIGNFVPVIFELKPTAAWSYLQLFINWSLETDKSTLFFFAKGIIEALQNIPATTPVFLKLPLEHPIYSNSDTYIMADIYHFYLSTAQLIAKEFDTRNENNNFSKQLAF